VTTICPLRFCNCVLRHHREFYEDILTSLSNRSVPKPIKAKRRHAFPPVTAGPIASPLMCFQKDQIVAYKLQSCRNRHNAPGVRLLRPNRGLHAASSGLHLRSCRDRRNAPGVHLLRPNRGLHAASSGLHLRSCRDRRNAPGVRLLRSNRGLPRRIKRSSPSVTMISDRLVLRALNAIRVVTYPAECHLEDYASLKGVA
jgi:transposase-like protein